jgi:hypothetical protein
VIGAFADQGEAIMARIALWTVLAGAAAIGVFFAGRASESRSQQSRTPDISSALDRLEQRMTRRIEESERRTLEAMPSEHRVLVERIQGGTPNDASPSASDNGSSREVAAEEPEPAPSPESMAAFEEAQKGLDQALARKTWDEQDRDALRANLNVLTDSQRFAVMDRLILAINQGKLNPTAIPPL